MTEKPTQLPAEPPPTEVVDPVPPTEPPTAPPHPSHPIVEPDRGLPGRPGDRPGRPEPKR